MKTITPLLSPSQQGEGQRPTKRDWQRDGTHRDRYCKYRDIDERVDAHLELENNWKLTEEKGI